MRGFFLDFPGCRVQSVLCFLKERTSSFLQSSLSVLIQPCLGKIILFLLVRVCSSLDEIYALMLILSEPWIFFYFCSIMSFFFLEYFLYSGGIFFFFVVFVGGVLCVFIHLLHLSLVPFILGVLGPWEFLWRAGSYFFCVGLRFVECRAGTIYLGVSLGWVAGLYGFSFSWVLLRWVRYD